MSGQYMYVLFRAGIESPSSSLHIDLFMAAANQVNPFLLIGSCWYLRVDSGDFNIGWWWWFSR